jgi:undecaprenyl-diphosphatase
MTFDHQFFGLLHSLAGQAKIFDWLLIFLASILPVILAFIFLFIIFNLYPRRGGSWRKRFYYFGFTGLSFSFSWLVLVLVRFSFPRPRPYLALEFKPLIDPGHSAALPSAHATVLFVLAFTLIYIFRKMKTGWLFSSGTEELTLKINKGRRASVWFFAAAVLVGLARVVVGAHWPFDILAGLVLGFISVATVNRYLPLSR